MKIVRLSRPGRARVLQTMVVLGLEQITHIPRPAHHVVAHDLRESPGSGELAQDVVREGADGGAVARAKGASEIACVVLGRFGVKPVLDCLIQIAGPNASVSRSLAARNCLEMAIDS